MHPTLFTVNGVGFHTWGLMLTLAFVAACGVTALRVGRVGVDPDRLVPIYLLAPLFGLAGARLLHFVFAEPAVFFGNPLTFFDFSKGGFAFYGGVILAGLGCAAYARMTGLPVLKLADVIAPAVLLGDSLGRVGCFFAGCCHGRQVGLPAIGTLLSLQGGAVVQVDGFPWLALVYRKGVGVGDIHDVPIFPTQPWESLLALALFALLSWVWRHGRRFDGQITAMALVLYAVVRYTVESFRGDLIRGTDYLGLFSTSQLVSIVLFALGALLFALRLHRGVAPESPWTPSP